MTTNLIPSVVAREPSGDTHAAELTGSAGTDTHAASLTGSGGSASLTTATNNAETAGAGAFGDGTNPPANSIAATIGTSEIDLATPASIAVPATPNRVVMYSVASVINHGSSASTYTIYHYRSTTQLASVSSASLNADNMELLSLATVLTDETAQTIQYKSRAIGAPGSGRAVAGTFAFAVGGSVSGDTHAASLTGSAGTDTHAAGLTGDAGVCQ